MQSPNGKNLLIVVQGLLQDAYCLLAQAEAKVKMACDLAEATVESGKFGWRCLRADFSQTIEEVSKRLKGEAVSLAYQIKSVPEVGNEHDRRNET